MRNDEIPFIDQQNVFKQQSTVSFKPEQEDAIGQSIRAMKIKMDRRTWP